jgi:hypothetical protein
MIEGADANKFTLAGNELTFKGTACQCNGFDFNTISRITSGCKSRGFEN